MKDRVLIAICTVSGIVMIGSVVGYFMTKGSAITKPSATVVKQTSVSDQTRTDAKKTASDVVVPMEPLPVTASTTLSLGTGNAKRYANANYGFSLLIPKDYWYEEDDADWGTGPVFTLSLEHPKLKPEDRSHPNGTTTLSKYGQLMFVNVCDRSLKRGKCPVDGRIDGMDFKQQSSSTVGGHTAQKFDDLAYTVVTDKYEYEIILNPILSDSLSSAEMKDMKRSFEDVVKTIWFD